MKRDELKELELYMIEVEECFADKAGIWADVPGERMKRKKALKLINKAFESLEQLKSDLCKVPVPRVMVYTKPKVKEEVKDKTKVDEMPDKELVRPETCKACDS